MPQAANNAANQSDQANSMAQSMTMMNTMMPVMSAVFCFTLPAGMGLYWIAGAVVRSIQQVVINKHIDKMDIDEIVKKNEAKRNEKLIKAGIDPKTVNKNANLSTRNVNTAPKKKSISEKAGAGSVSQKEKDEAMKESTGYYNKNAKPGSLAAKANMVKDYNEKNNK
jgi:YidC/Oxa1 family membrane protein insertase